jgi:hypothetical protein
MHVIDIDIYPIPAQTEIPEAVTATNDNICVESERKEIRKANNLPTISQPTVVATKDPMRTYT